MSINLNPYLYGFIDSYLEDLDENIQHDLHHDFCEVDRGFYLVEFQQEWNQYVIECELVDLCFIDDNWEVILECIGNVGRFVFTNEECDDFENYSHLKTLFQDADMSDDALNEILKQNGILDHIQELKNYFGNEEFYILVKYGKKLKKVNYSIEQLIEKVKEHSYQDILENSFAHYFYDECYDNYIIWWVENL